MGYRRFGRFLFAAALLTLVAALACSREVVEEVLIEKEIIIEKEVVREVPVYKEIIVEKEVVREVPVRQVAVVEQTLAQGPSKTMNIVIGQTYPNIVTHKAKSSGMSLLFDLMYSRIAMPNPNGFFEPDLAERWEVAPDASSYTFYIRKDAVWHDGEPVTANDIRFMWELLLEPEFPSWKASSFTIVKGGKDYLDGKTDSIPGLVVIDDHTIRFDMEEPSTIFFKTCCSLRNPIYPEHIYGDVAPSEMLNHPTWTNQATPIGSGAYRFVEHVSDQFAMLEANPDYHFGEANIDNIVINMISSVDARQIAIMRGDVDVLYHGLRPEGNAALIADGRFTIKGVQGSVVGAYAWNHDVEDLRDPRIRHAFAHALDRKKLIATFNTGNGIIYNSLLAHSWYQKPEWKDMFGYDPDKARALLKEAGWDSNREVRVLTGTPKDEKGASQLAAVQQMLGDVGFKIKYDTVDGAARTEKTESGDYDIFIGGFSIHSDPDGFLKNRLYTGSENLMNYAHPELDAMIEKGARALDPKERAKIYQEIVETKLMAEMPLTATWMTNSWYAMTKKVRIPLFDVLADPTSLYDVEVGPSFTHRLDTWNYHVEQWDMDQ